MIKIFAVFFASSLCVFAQTQMPSAKLIPDNSNAPQQSLQVPQQVAPTQNQAVEAEKIKAQKRKILRENRRKHFIKIQILFYFVSCNFGNCKFSCFA